MIERNDPTYVMRRIERALSSRARRNPQVTDDPESERTAMFATLLTTLAFDFPDEAVRLAEHFEAFNRRRSV